RRLPEGVGIALVGVEEEIDGERLRAAGLERDPVRARQLAAHRLDGPRDVAAVAELTRIEERLDGAVVEVRLRGLVLDDHFLERLVAGGERAQRAGLGLLDAHRACPRRTLSSASCCTSLRCTRRARSSRSMRGATGTGCGKWPLGGAASDARPARDAGGCGKW